MTRNSTCSLHKITKTLTMTHIYKSSNRDLIGIRYYVGNVRACLLDNDINTRQINTTDTCAELRKQPAQNCEDIRANPLP